MQYWPYINKTDLSYYDLIIIIMICVYLYQCLYQLLYNAIIITSTAIMNVYSNENRFKFTNYKK